MALGGRVSEELHFPSVTSGAADDFKKVTGMATFLGADEAMVKEAERLWAEEGADYYIFGHNHCAEVYDLKAGGQAVFLGHWFDNQPTFAVMNEKGELVLHK